MPRRFRPQLPLQRLPAEILPPDFVRRHDLVHRLAVAPLKGLTPPHPWAPMTDAEWDLLRPLLPGTTAGTPGRPMADPRARLDAIFRAVTLKRPDGTRAPWSALPDGFGRPDTIARLFRRWAREGLWERLLRLVADEGGGKARTAPLRLGLRWRVCCAFRRAIRLLGRLLGLAGIVLARRLGLFSALPGPSGHVADPDLSEIYGPVILRTVERVRDQPGWRPPRQAWSVFRGMLRLAGGRARLRRALEPA